MNERTAENSKKASLTPHLTPLTLMTYFHGVYFCSRRRLTMANHGCSHLGLPEGR